MPLKDGFQTETLLVTTAAAALGTVAGVTRAIRQKITPRRILYRALSSCLASFTIGSIVLETTTVTAQFVLIVGGVAGWAGGELMDLLADYLERQVTGKTGGGTDAGKPDDTAQ